MPDLEAINGTCNTETGVGCTDPAPGMEFYPIFTTRGPEDACSWQIGGALIPGTTNTCGGSSTTEYGPVLPLIYQGGLVGLPAVPTVEVSVDFHRNLNDNPCMAAVSKMEDRVARALRHGD